MNEQYDVVGDVHGNATKLVRLLEKMEYRKSERGGYYFHPERRAIFVGDLIDRGSENFKTLEIVKAMVDHRSASIVMGNHEYNALCYHTKDESGEYLRPHTPKNIIQHEKVIKEIEERGQEEWEFYLEWFRTMPLFLEIDGIRVVHACWKREYIDYISRSNIRDIEGRLTHEFLVRSSKKGSQEYQAIEILLKGEEIRLPDGHPGIIDKDGNLRKKLRFKWWAPEHEKKSARTYDQVVRADGRELEKVAGIEIPVEALEEFITNNEVEKENNVPVFFGHYWFSGEMKPLNGKAACLDYSVGLGGPLVSYRWDGEENLDASKFISAGPFVD